VQQELRKGVAANPFLSEFYLPEASAAEPVFIPPAHIGIVYASFRARLSLGDTASLLVSSPEDEEEEEVLRAEVEISVVRRDAPRPRTVRFETEQTSALRLGAYVEDVEITAPYIPVEIGPGAEAVFVAPVSVQCERLKIGTEKVVVESSPVGLKGGAVFLEANSFDGGQIASVPIVRGDVSLAAAWPGVRSHPWTNFASEPTVVDDPKLGEALRRFRKFVIAFRSHSKGSLARFKDKIEHARMTKGTGQAVLDLLVAERIVHLSLVDAMYYLNPDVLGSKANATYKDCMEHQFNDETIAFIRRALV